MKILFYIVFSKSDLILIYFTVAKRKLFFYLCILIFIINYLSYKTKHCITLFCFSSEANKNDSFIKTFLTIIINSPRSAVSYGGYIERRRNKIGFVFRKRIIKITEYILAQVEVRSC